MNRILPFVIAILTLPLSSCSDFREGKSLADTALQDFHEKFNSGNFDYLYEIAHADLKSTSGKEEFLQLMEAVHRKLGPVIDTVNSGWNVNNYNFKTYVSLTQDTTFQSGKGTESFIYQIQDKQAKLLQYNINSNDLIIK
jgi:hypothetical protein